jgi:hypothetical protein
MSVVIWKITGKAGYCKMWIELSVVGPTRHLHTLRLRAKVCDILGFHNGKY